MPFKQQFIECDLNLFPNKELSIDYEITIGDLHANALMLVNFLIRYGVIQITQKDYELLLKIYCLTTEELTVNHIKTFEQIIEDAPVCILRKVRFLGDMLCDRGCNDFYILKILSHLNKHNLEYEIILSNHDVEFLLYFEQYGFGQPYKAITIAPTVTSSLQSLIIFIDKKWVDKTWLQQIIQTVLLPKYKALSYTYEKTDDKNNLIIYSHAPIDLSLITRIAFELNISCSDEDGEAIKNNIDLINEKIQSNYIAGNIGKLFNGLFNPLINATSAYARSLERLIWNRTYEDLKRECDYGKFKIYYVHGHDHKGAPQHNIYTLDSELGKSLKNMQGEMHIFLSRGDKKKKIIEYNIGFFNGAVAGYDVIRTTKEQIGRFIVSEEKRWVTFAPPNSLSLKALLVILRTLLHEDELLASIRIRK